MFDSFLQDEIERNKLAAKGFTFVGIMPCIILIMVILGIFNFPFGLALAGVIVYVVFSIFFHIASRRHVLIKVYKYILCFVIQGLVFLYSFDCDMSITVTLMIAPVIAVMYLDPKFEILVCILAMISMFAGIIIQAPVTVARLFPDISPLLFILTTGGAHLVEMMVTSVLLTIVSYFAKSFVDTIHSRNREIEEIQNNLAYSFADMIESRDGTTGEHVKRTSKIVALIVEQLLKNPELNKNHIDPHKLQLIVMSAPLHDIGKIKVPDSILSKPGKLTDDEFAIIKTHPEEGAKLIDKTMANIENEEYVNIAYNMALYHHEKWNGTGYPKGLAGIAIPECARIMAVADVFDALCSKRSYKEPFPIDKAYEIMYESKGIHFEPDLVDILYELKPEMEKLYG